MISLMISWVKTTVDLLMVVGVNRRTSKGWRPNWSERSDMKRMALGDKPPVVGGCDDEVADDDFALANGGSATNSLPTIGCVVNAS